MRRVHSFFVILLLISSVVSQLRIRTTNGWIEGRAFDDQREFLGIPFARAPIGKLRFAAPSPPENWNGTRYATSFGKSCLQLDLHSDEMSEDCLFLNVYAPTNANNLPVLFFIHGGSWTSGSGAVPLYNGTRIIDVVPDVIVVTINYRLGPFGFLATSFDGSVTTGNWGLLDQRLAMAWVKDNIQQFGGDASRVTIFGESAGAGSISCHLVMPNSNGLYDNVIVESGPFAAWISRPLSRAAGQYQGLVQEVCQSSSNGLQCLQSLPAQSILLAKTSCQDTCWGPVVDGVEIKEAPPVLAAKGLVNTVPAIFGSNGNEGATFLPSSLHNLTAAEYEPFIYSSYKQIAPMLLKLYPLSDFESPWWALVQIWSNQAMNCPARQSVRWMSKANQTVPNWSYYFTRSVSAINDFNPYLGAFHGIELLFVFNAAAGPYYGHEISFTPQEQDLQKSVVKFWTNFSKNGNPNGQNLVTWPSNFPNFPTLNLNVPSTLEYDLLSAKCDFWDSIVI